MPVLGTRLVIREFPSHDSLVALPNHWLVESSTAWEPKRRYGLAVAGEMVPHRALRKSLTCGARAAGE